MTQPLLLEGLHEWCIDISSGQINRLLIEKKDAFHAEKDALLSAGLAVSDYIHVDDTGARHKGRNGYCTHIGNAFFAWFGSTQSKSRINFLELLRAGAEDYVLNEDALDYLEQSAFPRSLLPRLASEGPQLFADKAAWEAQLKGVGITTARHRQLATEGALLGSVRFHGVPKSLAIVSDDAGQFKLLDHALCWIHAERTINQIIPYGEDQRQAIEATRTQIWQFYEALLGYKDHPEERLKAALEAHHNNLSEQDIREYVKRRKVSGSTRSDRGRQARDTFTSLKKTCRKLGLSFWDYLNDRIGHLDRMPRLPELIHQCARAP